MLIRDKQPSFTQNFSFELPKPEMQTLANGARLYVLRGIQQEVFKLEFVFGLGKWNEPVKGLSHFLPIMLDKGTKKQSSKQISETLDFYGAQLEIVPGYDNTSVSLYGLNKSLPKLLPLVIELLSQSVFPESELELQKNIFIQNLRVNNKKTSYVASKLLRASLFGDGHPYGNSLEESDTISVLSQSLCNFFDKHLALENVFLVGNPNSEDLKWIHASLSEIDSKERLNLRETEVRPGQHKTERQVSTGVQASIRLGKKFINRNHEDYPLALLVNHILGGYFGSRLMKNIREEKGLTYGIYSSVQPFKNDCIFSIGADVNADKIDIVLSEIQSEIDKLSDNEISNSELNAARNHFLGGLQIELSNPFAVMEKLKNISINALAENYYQHLFEQIQHASIHDVQSVARKYLHALPFQVVVK